MKYFKQKGNMLLVWGQFETLRHKCLSYMWADTCVIEKGFMKKGQKCLKSDHRAGLNLGKMCASVSLSLSCSLHSDLPSDFHKFSVHFPALFQTSQTLQGIFLTILLWDPVCLSHSWSCIKTLCTKIVKILNLKPQTLLPNSLVPAKARKLSDKAFQCFAT